MKSFISIAVLMFAVQFCYGQDVAPKKTCKDFFPQQTCDNLKKLVGALKEAAGTIQEAIDAGVKANIQSTKDMLAFVKQFIADKIVCLDIMSQDMCTVLTAVANQLKITKKQLQMAIELAVNTSKATAKEIYENTLNFLKNDISCEKIFGKTACDNMLLALDKFKEQRSLLKEAIISVAVKHYKNTKAFLDSVQAELVKRIKNFKCETVLPADVCAKLKDITTRLVILPSKLKEAIEVAILNGIFTTTAIYDFAIDFLTNQITCDNILTPKACQNLVDATKKLGEQAKLIKEAIMAAALKHITNAAEIYKNVRDAVIAKALNFKCNDVLPQVQCDFLTRVATRFHVRTTKLTKIIVETIVNGTISAKALYNATIVALIQEAKDLKCTDLLQDANVCGALEALARNLHKSVGDLNEAIVKAITNGLTTITDIHDFVQTLLDDEESCRQLFKSYIFCKGLKLAGWVKGITFDRIVARLRTLYANGVTKISDLKALIRSFLDSFDNKYKRSADFTVTDVLKAKNEAIDWILQVVGGISKVTDKVKANVKAELLRLINAGKLTIWNARQTIKDLIAKFNPLSDEFEDEIPTDLQDMSEVYKKARVLFKKAIQRLIDTAKRFQINKDEFIKMIKDLYKSGIESINDATMIAAEL